MKIAILSTELIKYLISVRSMISMCLKLRKLYSYVQSNLQKI